MVLSPASCYTISGWPHPHQLHSCNISLSSEKNCMVSHHRGYANCCSIAEKQLSLFFFFGKGSWLSGSVCIGIVGAYTVYRKTGSHASKLLSETSSSFISCAFTRERVTSSADCFTDWTISNVLQVFCKAIGKTLRFLATEFTNCVKKRGMGFGYGNH